MKRKIISQGIGGYTVYLPNKWIKDNSLTKGTDVDIEEIDNMLIISPTEVKLRLETMIQLTGNTESAIRTIITNTYRKGYDKIIIEYDNEEQFKILQKIIKTKLIGFDILKKERNKCIVESVTEPSIDQFENILSKIFYNTGQLFESVMNKAEGKEHDDIEDIEERIQSYDNFCRRVISKDKLKNKKSEFLWTFLTLINHGQREIYHLSKIMNSKMSKEVIDLLKDAEKLFKLIEQSYFKKDRTLLADIHFFEKNIIYKKGYELLQKKGKENIYVYHILISIREFYQSNSPLMGIIV